MALRWASRTSVAAASLGFARRALDVQDVIRDWLGGLEWSTKVRVAVDVDPYSFL